MQVGAHLAVSRGPYTHHGIYAGCGRVIHYAGADGEGAARVRETEFDVFVAGSNVYVIHERPRYSQGDIVLRARSRIGERRYSLVANNCEHFARWCRAGERRSEQVERVSLAVSHSVARLLRRFVGGLA